MVPFYGQGLNCGLEDVRVLYELLRTRAGEAVTLPSSDHSPASEPSPAVRPDNAALAGALEEYSRTRHADLVAICELAMDN
jgi:kynurenine 3-monooxygenase